MKKRTVLAIVCLLLMLVPALAETEENWLLSDVNAAGEAGYCNLARVGGIEGYEFSGVQPGIMDQNLHYFVFVPVQTDAPAASVSVQTGKGDAAAVAGQVAGQIAQFGELLYGGEAEAVRVGDMNAYSVVLEYRMASYTEGQVYDYVQNAVVYIETPVAQRCVVLNAVNMGHDESVFSDREAMRQLLIGAAESVELVG